MTIQHDRAAMPDLAISIAQLGGGIGPDLESRYPELAWVFDKARDYDEIVSEWIPPDAKVWDDAGDLETAVAKVSEGLRKLIEDLQAEHYPCERWIDRLECMAETLESAPSVAAEVR